MDRTDQTTTDVPRRTVIRGTTAGLLALSSIGTATAHDDHGEGERKDDRAANEENEEGRSDEDDEEGESDEEPTASIEIDDQTIEGGSVRISNVSISEDGYVSIHDISRFSGADVDDVSEIDEIPERENPICGSIVGISDLLEAGEYSDIEVPLYNEAAPAVGFHDHFPEQSLQESQPFIAIPHVNKTGKDEFVCGEDPPEDGAFLDGPNSVPSLGAVNDIAAVLLESDSSERKEEVRELKEAILDGSIAPPSDDEDEESENAADEDGDDDAGDGDDQKGDERKGTADEDERKGDDGNGEDGDEKTDKKF